MSMIAKLKQRLKESYAVAVIRRSPLFDEAWYRRELGNTLPKDIDAAAHYLHGGWKEHEPSASFQGRSYLLDNPDVAESGICPLLHFERHGKHEGYRSIPFYAVKSAYRSRRLLRTVSRAWGRCRCHRIIQANMDASILVCFQLFYPQAWWEVREYLRNLMLYHYDLVVTYQPKEGMDEVLASIQAFQPKAILLSVDNVGFDVGGFHRALQAVHLEEYELVIKLHSKGTARKHTYAYHRYFGRRDWFVYLFEGVVGAQTVHRTIDRLRRDSTCGLVAAENLLTADPRHKRSLVRQRLAPYPKLSPPEAYQYVAGTCFAIRAELLKTFAEQSFQLAQSRRGEFTLAHALERALCFSAQENGWYIAGNRVCCLRQARCRMLAQLQHFDVTEALLNDPRVDLDDEFCCRDLESMQIKSYQLISIRLGDIRRRWFDGKMELLTQCAPYRYLCGDTQAYRDYCEYYQLHGLYAVSQEKLDALFESIAHKGFDTRKAIVLREDNSLMDGQHRACCLLKLYGEEYKVPAVILH